MSEDRYTDTDPEYRDTPLNPIITRPTIDSCPPLRGTQRHQHLPPYRQPYTNHNRNNHRRSRSYQRRSPRTHPSNAPRSQQYQQAFTPHYSRQPQVAPTRDLGEQQQHTRSIESISVIPSSSATHERESIQTTIEDPNFCYCKLPFEETKELEGLKILVGPIHTPDYDIFCISAIVNKLLEKKRELARLSHEELTAARGRSNPYEKTGHSIFMNRAAVKLACLDATNKLTGVSNPEDESNKIYRFADLCGGPGGFSEYILWRKHTSGDEVFGWGITLVGDNDYSLDKFLQETLVNTCFEPLYGIDGTGDIYKEENIREFGKIILVETQGVGVDLVTADGGLNFRGQEENQETRVKQLILCQVIAMFLALQQDGDFVLKLFDIFTPFTASIVWILYRHFKCIRILKPLPSRPANSERYIICRELHQSRPTIINHLFAVNRKFNELKNNSQEQDVTQIVTLEEMQKDETFMQYLRTSNMMIALKQTDALDLLLEYARTPELSPKNQDENRRKCFQDWALPLDERYS